MSIPYNSQDIRDALESFVNSPQSDIEYRASFSKLSNISEDASHYVIKRRALAARYALVWMHVHGNYCDNRLVRREVRRRAALG